MYSDCLLGEDRLHQGLSWRKPLSQNDILKNQRQEAFNQRSFSYPSVSNVHSGGIRYDNTIYVGSQQRTAPATTTNSFSTPWTLTPAPSHTDGTRQTPILQSYFRNSTPYFSQSRNAASNILSNDNSLSNTNTNFKASAPSFSMPPTPSSQPRNAFNNGVFFVSDMAAHFLRSCFEDSCSADQQRVKLGDFINTVKHHRDITSYLGHQTYMVTDELKKLKHAPDSENEFYSWEGICNKIQLVTKLRLPGMDPSLPTIAYRPHSATSSSASAFSSLASSNLFSSFPSASVSSSLLSALKSFPAYVSSSSSSSSSSMLKTPRQDSESSRLREIEIELKRKEEERLAAIRQSSILSVDSSLTLTTPSAHVAYTADDDERMHTMSEDEAEEREDNVGYMKGTSQRDSILISARLDPVSSEDDAAISAVLRGPDTDEVLIMKFSIDMTRHKMKCLARSVWLNDEIINFYMEMLKERDNKLCEVNPKRRPSWFFSSFFIAKVLEDGEYSYSRVKRWAKRFDAFAQDKIFFPVNIANNHWVLVVAHVMKKKVVFYDSFHSSGKKYVDAVYRWLQDEHKAKKGTEMDCNGWEVIPRDDTVPRQLNGSDCGVFVVIASDFISDDLPLEYDQDIVTSWRKNLGAAILRGSLDYPMI